MIDAARRDLRYTVRLWRRRPTAIAAAILCLGLGIGASTTMFGLIDAVLLRPLPYANPDSLHRLHLRFPDSTDPSPASGWEFIDFQNETELFAAVGGMISWGYNLDLEIPRRVIGGRVSADLLGMLGVAPTHGRLYTRQEEELGEAVLVLSHGLWQSLFGADPQALGRRLTLSGVPHTVIGVMPPDFRPLPEPAELWVPLVPNPRVPRQLRGVEVLVQPAPGLGPVQIEAGLERLTRRFASDHPELYPPGFRLELEDLRESVVGDVRGRLWAIFGAVALVLAIACANVAQLLLAQALGRRREIGLRLALGAGRGRLLGQLLTESLALAALAGALGLALAHFGTRLVVVSQADQIPRLEEAGLDPSALGFALGVALLTGVLSGLAPALGASSAHLAGALREGGRGDTGDGPRRRWLGVLVIAEIALATVVLIGAGLMLRTVTELTRVDPGFAPRGLVTMQVSLPHNLYRETSWRVKFLELLAQDLRTQPEIEAVALASTLPFVGLGVQGHVRLPGQAADDLGPLFGWSAVEPAYFEVLGIPLLRGRSFDSRDHASAAPVAIVGAGLAERLWPGENPVGRQIELVGGARDGFREVVGVVGQVRHGRLDQSSEQLYLPYAQYATPQIVLGLRSGLEAGEIVTVVRRTVTELDQRQPVDYVQAMEDRLAELMAAPRFNLTVFVAFGLIALALTVIGIFGLMSYAVARRTGEFGLRAALGARRCDILTLVLRDGLSLTAAGLAAGLTMAWAALQILDSTVAGMIYGVAAFDPATFGAAALVLVVSAAAAAMLPAGRAARIDPAVALRQE